MERRRSERTGDSFVLMLMEFDELLEERSRAIIPAVCSAIRTVVRDCDFDGWYHYPSIMGMIFTAIGDADRTLIEAALGERVESALAKYLGSYERGKVKISFHFFPEQNGGLRSDEKLYPDLTNKKKTRSLHEALKRSIDIAGSLAGLILSSPLLLAIAILIKATSKGPVLFRQRRIGKFGKEFDFLKFRSMAVNCDSRIHQQYIQQLIQQKVDAKKSNGVFKIVNDPRITPVGRFLRKSSLDELPQFLNVLMGHMSLVGPRPPIPYEVSSYKCWHRRRVIEVKPGITGLWQVYGRSRTTFDEMVRLDLRYIRQQSILLDLKIILKTPQAILSGSGAY
jgi:lipopolysaccharide/colanic/teichoic acid biosynthesis glycosyltransferase